MVVFSYCIVRKITYVFLLAIGNSDFNQESCYKRNIEISGLSIISDSNLKIPLKKGILKQKLFIIPCFKNM